MSPAQSRSLVSKFSKNFYVKSHFGESKQSKNDIFSNFIGSKFWFLVNLSNFQVPDLPKFKVWSLWNCQKWHFAQFKFAKIQFHIKFENFLQVLCMPSFIFVFPQKYIYTKWHFWPLLGWQGWQGFLAKCLKICMHVCS